MTEFAGNGADIHVLRQVAQCMPLRLTEVYIPRRCRAGCDEKRPEWLNG